MVKILSGVVAAILIAVGGFFGFQLYTQYRVANEIEAAFEQIRATGAKASHGKVSFDLKSRTVTVADIAGETTAQPPVSVKIASVTASGVSQPGTARFSADSIDLTDIEIGVEMPSETLLRVTYRAPRIAVKDYSGPTGIQRLPASSSFIDLYRFGFEQLAIMRATSVVAPSLTGKMKFSAAMRGGSGDGDFTYSGLAVEGLEDGRVAAMKADDFLFTFVQPAGKTKTITGNLANFVAYDTDFNAMAAIYDTQKANDDRYYRVYRQISAGAFAIRFDQSLTMRVEGFTADDLAMRPSRLQLPALMAMTPPAGTAPPTPAQERKIMEKAADVYEGVRIGNAEMRGLSVETPQGPLKLAMTRFNMENGKIGELALEGLDTQASNGPVKVGRFALKSLDIANLMRMGAQFSNPAQPPAPDAAFALLPLLEGAEVKTLVAPYKNSDKPVNIDTLSLNWGQFIGPIPSQARLTLKMSAPLDANDPGQKMLVAAGLDRLAIDFDLGATWTEASRAFALEPVKLDFAGQFKASARVSLTNVPRQVFSVNPAQTMAAAAQLDVGTIELTVQDIAGVDRAIAQLARQTNVSREAFRSNFVEEIRASGKKAAATNPDIVAASETLARFVETPGQTLNLKLTPLGKVPAMQLIQLLKTDPLIALAQFRIEASTGL
jgi:hypothetical protein